MGDVRHTSIRGCQPPIPAQCAKAHARHVMVNALLARIFYVAWGGEFYCTFDRCILQPIFLTRATSAAASAAARRSLMPNLTQ